jgi:PTS system fructose-specific IIC component
VPHCRTDAVNRLICALGLKPEGIDFGAFDGQPSRVFVLTLSPISDPTPHVQFMSQMVQVLTPNVCRRLLRAESTHEVVAILSARPEAEPTPAAALPTPRQPVPHAIRANALTDAVVVPRLRAVTKEGAIDELLGALAAAHPIDDLPQVRRQLLQREQVMSTGLERGIAVPHCRTAAVSRVLCALGLKPEGLDFGSQDGAPAQIVVLILASTSMPTPYAQTLALLLHALNRTNRTAMFACTDAATLRAMILQAVEGVGESKG